MRKKYRIKEIKKQGYVSPWYKVQVHRWFGWVDVKVFYYTFDPDFARREAEELLDKLIVCCGMYVFCIIREFGSRGYRQDAY